MPILPCTEPYQCASVRVPCILNFDESMNRQKKATLGEYDERRSECVAITGIELEIQHIGTDTISRRGNVTSSYGVLGGSSYHQNPITDGDQDGRHMRIGCDSTIQFLNGSGRLVRWRLFQNFAAPQHIVDQDDAVRRK